MANEQEQFIFFGTPQFAVDVLKILEANDRLPTLVVTAPDRPRGRGQKLQQSAIASWADKRGIPTLKPEKITTDFIANMKNQAPKGGWPLAVVIAYGHILPAELIYLPEHNTLNLHPSLLPKLRGPAPIRGAILEEDKTGVSIIELDEQMDHGPIVAQTSVATEGWPPDYDQLKSRLTAVGGQLLTETIPAWLAGSITPRPQEETEATYSQKFSAADGEIDLIADPEANLRKIRAFTGWPKAHFFKDNRRILITKAHLEKGALVIDRVKPAGDEEMSYSAYQKKA